MVIMMIIRFMFILMIMMLVIMVRGKVFLPT